MKANVAVALFVALAGASAASAQWIDVKVPGTPRTADGKPDLHAPTPRTADGKPDLTGIWTTIDNHWLVNLAADGVEVPFRPAALALYQERQANNWRGRPSERCLPHGVTDFDTLPFPTKFIQTPAVTVILFEAYNTFRQIQTDGRALPVDPQPSWLGYSVGHWEGDTLVADTIGLNDKTWLDDSGHPHTEALHVVERFHRRDFGHMETQITVDDPEAYTRPWTVTIQKSLMPDTELIEFICENEKDYVHLVGK